MWKNARERKNKINFRSVQDIVIFRSAQDIVIFVDFCFRDLKHS